MPIKTVPIDAVATQLGISPWTVRTWARQGRLATLKVGRRILVKEEDVEALIEKNYRPAVDLNGVTPPVPVASPRRRRKAATA